jgi:Fe-S cluster assembly protein SufD
MLQVAREKNREQEAYFAAFRGLAAKAAETDPAWLGGVREKAFGRFAELGFPTTRDEEWKYTNVAPIIKTTFGPAPRVDLTALNIKQFLLPEAVRSRLVFVNGRYAPGLSHLDALPDDVKVFNFSVADQAVLRGHLAAYADHHGEAFTALNTAFIGDGALVHVPAGKVVPAPIHLLFVSTASEAAFVSHPRVLVVAEPGAAVTVVESYVALGEGVYFTNAVTEVVTRRDANVEHYRLQQESERAFHVAATRVEQERGSRYSSYAVWLGAELARHTLNVRLGGEAIESTVDGLYVVNGKQHVDNHTTIDHAAPHSASFQLYKGILDDRARAVFNGKIFVREGALLTDARQLNKNLLLSGGAHVDTKPQLEIFADDVKCAHGATVGQLEEEELFYLRSRGLKPDHARALLTYGFAEDVISKIKVASVRKRLDEAVLAKLHQNLEVE